MRVRVKGKVRERKGISESEVRGKGKSEGSLKKVR